MEHTQRCITGANTLMSQAKSIIDGGRISKLMLKQDGTVVYNYDRGLDIAPQTKEAEQALAILMYEHN